MDDRDPRGRNGDSSNDDYKEDPHDLWALRQHQLGNKDPRCEPKSWLPKDGSQKSEGPSWLLAHPNEKLLQCVTCRKWAYGSRCNHTKIPNMQMSEHALPIDGNDNVNSPLVGKISKGVVYIDDDVLPNYEYFDEENNMATTEGSYLGSKESNTSDDDGHKECGIGGYKNCPDNPERRSTSGEEDSFDENLWGLKKPLHSGDRGVKTTTP